MELGAVIFDLDGVIVDTAEHHYRAWKRLAEELGIPCPRERKDQVRGISRLEALRIVLGDEWSRYEGRARELADRKDAYYRELIEGLGPGDLLPGALELIRDLKRHGVKVAVATVSRNGRTVLTRLGILGEFDAVVDGHSGARSKPAPDLFLYAARDLHVPPSRCLVVEDAPAGIAAAEIAGMASLALGEASLFAALRPDLILPDLRGLDYSRLRELLDGAAAARASWTVGERDLTALSSGAKEAIFSVGNGYLGARGTAEERIPGECRATLINGLYDGVPLFFTELAPVPDWTWAELRLGGVRVSPAGGDAGGRVLDLRDGILRRHVRWRHPDGGAVEVRTMRFASMAEPHLAVQVYAVTSLDFAGEAELVFRLDGAPVAPGLPPFPEVGLAHWEPLAWGTRDGALYVRLRTRRSGVELAAATCVLPFGLPEGAIEVRMQEGIQPAISLRARLSPGETLFGIRFYAVATSAEAPDPASLCAKVLAAARERGLPGILEDHRRAWAALWEDCDLVIEGDEELQRAVRFNLYHLLISAPHHAEGLSIPAKGLTGFGYRGHVFWDTEIFMLPFFVHTAPALARRILMYRYRTLPGARENARKRGYRGAMYAWESADDGTEVTPRWIPAPDGSPVPIRCGELEHHITADVAYAVWQYWRASGDDAFMRDHGAEILFETARFWASRAEPGADGLYHITGVMGPDEYHEEVDDNAFTNLMAKWNLEAAREAWAWLEREHPARLAELSARIGLSADEVDGWGEIAGRIAVPRDEGTGLVEQFRGYFSLEDVDLGALDPRGASVRDILGPERTNRSQVIKQPDVLMLIYLLRDRV
ncbi:MAG: beta-phosphoglucomutase, partial [Caldiserica bacterium]|nr:beta-phosphoglucomutase [Caldisericota bacterium]